MATGYSQNAPLGRAVQAVGLPLIAVLRDHRLEGAFLSGHAVELETRGRVLRASSAPGGMILQDLTEMRRAQENARELLAVLSHELRTPATTIRSTSNSDMICRHLPQG